ncbi:MAG TPA: hypothetical protein PLL71_14190, partial [Agriterribacter sp.]|nr:hypothetical protein [Agriterribacter sp.]
MKKRIIHIIIVWVTVCLLAGCSSTRKLPAGEALYTGATIKIEDPAPRNKEKKKIKAELEALTRPLPNKTILGMPFKLWMYNLAGNPKKEKSIGGWLKYKVGEPPVLAGDVNLEWNVKVLQSTLENRGYFKAVVQGDSILKNKKTRVVYTVQTGNRYIINEVVFDKDSAVLQKTINVSS